jgi:hypothetical protein
MSRFSCGGQVIELEFGGASRESPIPAISTRGRIKVRGCDQTRDLQVP